MLLLVEGIALGAEGEWPSCASGCMLLYLNSLFIQLISRGMHIPSCYVYGFTYSSVCSGLHICMSTNVNFRSYFEVFFTVVLVGTRYISDQKVLACVFFLEYQYRNKWKVPKTLPADLRRKA